MIKSIPKMQSRRPRIVDNPRFTLPPKKHSSVEANEEHQKKHEEQLKRIQIACASFRNACPESWKIFEEDFRSLYNYIYALDRKSPWDLIGQGIDPGYFAIMQSTTQGQLEIIESILGTLQIKVIIEKVEPPIIEKNNFKDFVNKVLTVFRIL